ncbi:MAG TPA: MBL fold metallo-hydrolase [Actinomycetota bacterium]|nr:MBL fold metallo-hydrolase [Actinomycetota bacterium]
MSVTRLSHDVWAIAHPFVSAYVIVADEPVVVDTGVAKRVTDLVVSIDRIGVHPPSVRHIAVTHYHLDHIGGLSRLQTIAGNATTCVHPVDAPVARGEAPHPGPSSGGWKGSVGAWLGPRLAGRPSPARVDREILDGEHVCEGLLAVHTPGHTGGHVSYLWEPEGVLFVGDAASNMRGELAPPIGFFTEDRQLMKESILRLAGLEFEVAVFGHGKPIERDAASAFRALAGSL